MSGQSSFRPAFHRLRFYPTISALSSSVTTRTSSCSAFRTFPMSRTNQDASFSHASIQQQPQFSSTPSCSTWYRQAPCGIREGNLHSARCGQDPTTTDEGGRKTPALSGFSHLANKRLRDWGNRVEVRHIVSELCEFVRRSFFVLLLFSVILPSKSLERCIFFIVLDCNKDF